MFEDDYDESRKHLNSLIKYQVSIDKEFLHSERIPEAKRLHKDDLIDGLMYIDKVNPTFSRTRDYNFYNDTMYIFADLGEFKQEDILYLYRLGFLINQEDDGFIHF